MCGSSCNLNANMLRPRQSALDATELTNYSLMLGLAKPTDSDMSPQANSMVEQQSDSWIQSSDVRMFVRPPRHAWARLPGAVALFQVNEQKSA